MLTPIRRVNTPPRAARGPGRLGDGLRTACLLLAVATALGAGQSSTSRRAPPAAPLQASWFDRTQLRPSGAWVVRSDLGIAATASVLKELAQLGGRFNEMFGAVGERLNVWCFADRREAEDTVRTRLGGRVDPDRAATFVSDPVGGGEGVLVVVPRSGDAASFRSDLARAVASYGMESLPSTPPWLAHGAVEWFEWAMRPETAFEGLRPPPSLRREMRDATLQGRRLGADRLVRLDHRGWDANRDAGSGALQRAEAGALVGVLMAEPATRDRLRRLITMPPRGATPLERWRRIWPNLSPSQLDEAIGRAFSTSTTTLEQGLREASWLASGRAGLADFEDASTPSILRSRLAESRHPIVEACLAGDGRCARGAPEPIIEWTPLEQDLWTGRCGRWRFTLRWQALAAPGAAPAPPIRLGIVGIESDAVAE